MRKFVSRLRRDRLAVVAAVVVPLGVAAVLSLFRSEVEATHAALVLVVAVVAIAANGQRLAGAIAALSASLWFDFFFTQPYDHFAITSRSDIETTVLLLVVGVAVSELAARGRKQRRIATEESNFLALIHDFGQMVATGESSQFVVMRAAAELSELLNLKDCRFEEVAPDGNRAHLDPGGRVILSGMRWEIDELGLPGKEVELVVQSEGRVRGRFVMVPTPGWPVSLERGVVAAAVADQVGAALAAERRGGTST